MPICRNLLHQNRINEFKDFLKTKGWNIENIKGEYEVLRATKHDQKPIILYQRLGTDHATIGWNMPHALKLVNKFIRSNYAGKFKE